MLTYATINCCVQEMHMNDNELCNIRSDWNEEYVHSTGLISLYFHSDRAGPPAGHNSGVCAGPCPVWLKSGSVARFSKWPRFFNCGNNRPSPALSNQIKKDEFSALLFDTFPWCSRAVWFQNNSDICPNAVTSQRLPKANFSNLLNNKEPL
jgi:hypothetical protein